MHKTSVSLRTTAKPVGRPPHRRRKYHRSLNGDTLFKVLQASFSTCGTNNAMISYNWSSLLDGCATDGNDILTGGEGNDKFVFLANSNSGKNVITDFQAGSDKVVFADVVSADKLSNAVWDDASHTLSFSGVGKDGHTYNNSVTFNGLSSGETLDGVLQKHVEFLG